MLVEYAKFVMALAKPLASCQERLDHAYIGMLGELGELADAWKKHYLYEQPLDTKNVLEELGDFRFYWQVALNELSESNLQAFYSTVRTRNYAENSVLQNFKGISARLSQLEEKAIYLPEVLLHLFWRYEGLRDRFGFTEEQVLSSNYEKLKARYPAGSYTNEHAKLRLDKKIETVKVDINGAMKELAVGSYSYEDLVKLVGKNPELVLDVVWSDRNTCGSITKGQSLVIDRYMLLNIMHTGNA